MNPEQSAQAAETRVPPGQVPPAAQAVSAKTQEQMFPEVGVPYGQAATQVRPRTKVPSGHELMHV